ncbi:MAG TPA: DUF983 domain-containing protein [Bacteroidia bacterium]|jgi:uncharacterized protein (DUF983 family)
MNYKESKLYSIMNNKCPHCHKGNFWETGNPYDLKRFSRMNNRCPVCNEDFKREPGYYFGATYVSYGMTVGFGIALYVILSGIFKMETVPFLVTFSILLILLMPLFYRSARLIWINFFVSYKDK